MTADVYPLLSTSALLVVGLISYFKYNEKIQLFLNTLLILVTLQFLQNGISPKDNDLFITGMMGSLVGINLLFASLLRMKKLKWVVPVISILIILVVGKNSLMYSDYSLDFSNPKVTGIIILGFLIGVISYVLKIFLQRFFTGSQKETIQLTAQIVLTGLFVIPATFFVSWYGFLLLAIGFFLYDMLSEQKNGSLIIALLTFGTMSHFLSLYAVDGVDLSVGKVIAGIVVGAGAYSLGILGANANNKLVGLILLFLGISAVALVTLLNNVHPAYGGVESFIAALSGMALASLFAGKDTVGNVLFPAFLAIGLLLPSDPFLETTGEQSTVSGEPIDNETITEEEPKGLDATTLSGKYTIVSKTAVISFQLGQKGGITKGAIKEFEGTVDFGNNIETAKFNVKLPVKKLTTFNSMRDESVWGAAYLNEPKFPVMSFSSSKMEAKEDGYLLKGDFTLLGKTNKEDVFIKYLGEKDGKQLFTGKAAIDRTKYGMPSSPQEGNIVDFTFNMELEQ